MKTKEEILEWLRQHDWYQSFKINTVNFNSITLDEYLSDITIKKSQGLVIRTAFYWADTKEGVLYWSEIDEEYLKWLKSDNTNKTMKQTIEIEVPEGKKAVWKDGKVVFEDIKPELPKTWEEFCGKYPEVKKEYYIDNSSETAVCYKENRHVSFDRNLLPTKEAAEAHLALMQLHQLRDCYRQGWVPDWEDAAENKWCIIKQFGKNNVVSFVSNGFFLAFPKKEVAEEFLRNFESLIKKAGDLI